MTELLTTLKSKIKLTKAVQPLKDQQIKSIIDILQSALDDRQLQREEDARIQAEKQQKIADLKRAMKEAGLTTADLTGKSAKKPKR